MWVERYQRAEEVAGRQYVAMVSELEDARMNVRAPSAGWAVFIGTVAGATHPDGWVSPHVILRFRAIKEITRVELDVHFPEFESEERRTLTVQSDITTITFYLENSGVHKLEYLVRVPTGSEFNIEIRSSPSYNPARVGRGNDARNLGFVLRTIVFYSD